jgi:hypothetical protein
MGDSNLVVDLPNIISVNTYLERSWMGDGIWNYGNVLHFDSKHLINFDTIEVELRSTLYAPFVCNEDFDPSYPSVLKDLRTRVLGSTQNADIIYNRLTWVHGRRYYMIKWKEGSVLYYYILYYSKLNALTFQLKNLKDEQKLMSILTSIKFESRVDSYCW